MKRPSFFAQILFAAGAATLVTLGFIVAAPIFGRHMTWVVLSGLTTLTYCWWHIGPHRAGLATFTIGFAVVTMAAAVFTFSHATWLGLLALTIWLVRSVINYRSIMAAAADLLLTSIAALAALATFAKTHSMGWAVWTFFLLSALSGFIPALGTSRNRSAPPGDRSFATAYAAAQSALDRVQGGVR